MICTTVSASGLVLNSDGLLKNCTLRLGQVITLAVTGICAMFHVFAVLLEGVTHNGCNISVTANEFGRRREGQIHQVMEDEDLTVALRTSADADDGDFQLRSDGWGNFAWNAFKNDGAGPRFRKGASIFAKGLDGLGGVALNLITAHAVHGLRSK